ncbi:MAG: TIGR04282 family arsenosugar biosynthesis glycosyltransferase [Pseudomonadota bacterium]|nr:TIGR04282 family arsenosugar biosynthesis glycosyltransferase [Pseudomonadota bacterium]
MSGAPQVRAPAIGCGRVQVFGRAPEPGVSKTRLIPRLGAAGAAKLHAQLLRHTFRALQPAQDRLEFWATPRALDDRFVGVVPASVPRFDQQGADLGARMAHALRDGLRRSEAVVLVGSDAPGVDAQYVCGGLRALAAGADLVLGPAEDGGYVLVGLRRLHPELFLDIPWGSAEVMVQTESRARALGLSILRLETLWDIDRPSDVERLRNWQRNNHWYGGGDSVEVPAL